MTLAELSAAAAEKRTLLKKVFNDFIPTTKPTIKAGGRREGSGDVDLVVPLNIDGNPGALVVAFFFDQPAHAGGGLELYGQLCPLGPLTKLKLDQPSDWMGWAFETKMACDDYLANGDKCYVVKKDGFGLSEDHEFKQGESMMIVELPDLFAILPDDTAKGWKLLPKQEFHALIEVGMLAEDE